MLIRNTKTCKKCETCLKTCSYVLFIVRVGYGHLHSLICRSSGFLVHVRDDKSDFHANRAPNLYPHRWPQQPQFHIETRLTSGTMEIHMNYVSMLDAICIFSGLPLLKRISLVTNTSTPAHWAATRSSDENTPKCADPLCIRLRQSRRSRPMTHSMLEFCCSKIGQ